jgi:hypothetical protein
LEIVSGHVCIKHISTSNTMNHFIHYYYTINIHYSVLYLYSFLTV